MIALLKTSYNKYDPLIGRWLITHKQLLTRILIAVGVFLSLIALALILGYESELIVASDFFGEMGSAAVILILILLILSPLSALTRSRTLLSMMTLRRGAGILAAIMAIIHGVGYIDMGSLQILLGGVSTLSLAIGSGSIALVLMILLLTSNDFSQKLLKKRWKTVQRLSYIALLFAVIHAVMMSGEYGLIAMSLIYIGLKIAHIVTTHTKKHAA